MSFTCPRGHASATDDYCSVCGIRNPGSAVMADERPETSGAANESLCLVCGVQRDGMDRYCVNCGYDFERGEPFVPAPEPEHNGYAAAPATHTAASTPSVMSSTSATAPSAPSLVLLA